MKVERMKLDCDRFRQKSQEETGLSDKKYDTEIDDIVCHRKQLDVEMEALRIMA